MILKSKRKASRLIRKLLVVATLLVSAHFTITITLGDISYSRTYNTIYNPSGSQFLTRTAWAELKSNRKIVNLELIPSCPGHVGYLVTHLGFVHYEYGLYAPPLIQHTQTSGFMIQVDTINGYFVRTIRKDGEFGFHIPKQKGMKWGLTIYPSSTASKLDRELMEVATTAKYDLYETHTP